MEIHPRTLLSLPSEILQQIATYLPPSTIFCLLLVSQTLRRSVDHWAVWKSYLVNNPRFPNGIPESAGEGNQFGTENREGRWKKYVLADISAQRWKDSRRQLEETDLRWLPMLLAIGHPITRTLKPEMVMHLAIPPSKKSQTENSQFKLTLNQGVGDGNPRLMFPVNPDTALSLDQWQSKLAGSFCLAMAYMSALSLQQEENEQNHSSHENFQPQINSNGTFEISDHDTDPPPVSQLSRVPWFNFNPHDPSLSLSPSKREILITALHALSLNAIAHFTTEFELAVSEYRTASTTLNQVSHPPTSKTISSHLWKLASFSSHSSTPSPNSYMPLPFSPSCVQNFGRSHIPYMAREEFFEQGEWTGAFAYTSLWGVRSVGSLDRGSGRDVFDCIGGVNRMVQLRGWDVLSGLGNGREKANVGDEDRGQVFVDGVVKFRSVFGDEERDGDANRERGRRSEKKEDVFTLRSNTFYSQMGIHKLQLRVKRSTGLITVEELDVHTPANGQADSDGTRKNGSENENFKAKENGKRNCRGGVLTPFGIVGAMGVGASWMWLWKREWSGGVEEER